MYKKIYRSMCFLAIVILLLSSLLVFSACFTSFNTKYKSEVKSETILISNFLNNQKDTVSVLKNAADKYKDKRVTLISVDGKVVYDNSADVALLEDHNSRPEIFDARKNGFGEAERFSVTGGKKQFYYAVKLNDGSILRVASPINAVYPMLYAVIIAILFMVALIYILTAIIAVRITENIMKPIENIRSFESVDFDDVYDEIKPFLKRISHQNMEINRQMNKIKSQKVRLQTIMDNINEGLLIVDKNDDIVSANDCAANIFNADKTRLKYKNLAFLTQREEIHTAFVNAFCGVKSNLVFETDNKIYQIFSSPLYEKEAISGAVMLLFDVSEKTQSEKIRREFTANVSHELKTPLTTIHGYAQIIGSGIAKPDDVLGFVKKIEKESSRLIALVDDIIKLSHLDESTREVQKQNISMRFVVNEILESISSKAEEKDIKITVNGDDTTVFANLSQTTEMIYNLVDNAIKYNKYGGKVAINIFEKKLVITDTGIGIPEKYYDRIFERFFRVDKSHSKKVNGTGLGLSIVKHLAQANNIDIKVSSIMNEGTEFTITFSGGHSNEADI